jgi:hypothetical protein
VAQIFGVSQSRSVRYFRFSKLRNPFVPGRGDAAGLRPVQIWVPDTRRPGFAAECHRQSVQTALADAGDRDLQDFLDTALGDLDSEGEA